tara:strand:- start:3471 stop:4520 length:1050 start_codon:yes stop_codon:yes gene_type:complete
MSAMLEQAIVDATSLREAAVKSAEHAVIQKYSSHIKDAVDQILEEDLDTVTEQEDPAGGASEVSFGKNAPEDVDAKSKVDDQLDELDKKGEAYAFLEGTDLSELEEGEEVEINIEDLLAEAFETEELEENNSEEDEDEDESIVVEEDLDIDNEEIDDLIEALEMDYEGVPMAGTTAFGATVAQQKRESVVLDVLKQIEEYNGELEKENEGLKKEHKEVEQKHAKLLKENKKLVSNFKQIAEKFKQVELFNIKLLYTNKVLMDDSLNERQKQRVVESINKSQTSEQAEIVYETLQGAVGPSSETKPESLSEAVGKRSSSSLLIHATKPKDPKAPALATTRWQVLAGIGKK